MWNCPMQILKAFMIVRKSYNFYLQKLKDWIYCSSLVEKIIKYLLLLGQNINKELHLSQGVRTLLLIKKTKKIFCLLKFGGAFAPSRSASVLAVFRHKCRCSLGLARMVEVTQFSVFTTSGTVRVIRRDALCNMSRLTHQAALTLAQCVKDG